MDSTDEATLNDWAAVMECSADDATRSRVQRALKNSNSPLSAFLKHLAEDRNSLIARSLQTAKSKGIRAGRLAKTPQAEYVIIRHPSLTERCRRLLTFPVEGIFRAAAYRMAEDFYFSSAAQIQDAYCRMLTFGVRQLAERRQLANYLILASKPDHALSVLMSLIDQQTHHLANDYLVGLTVAEVELEQTLVSETIAQYFVDQKILNNAANRVRCCKHASSESRVTTRYSLQSP